MNVMEAIDREGVRTDLQEFAVGDSVDVVVKIVEGERNLTQTFSGTVIAKNGSGVRETFTVRRVVQGEGVEKVFPVCSPLIVSVKVTLKGKTKRSKLYYLRDRVGKATKIKGTHVTSGTAGKESLISPSEDESGTAEDEVQEADTGAEEADGGQEKDSSKPEEE